MTKIVPEQVNLTYSVDNFEHVSIRAPSPRSNLNKLIKPEISQDVNLTAQFPSTHSPESHIKVPIDIVHVQLNYTAGDIALAVLPKHVSQKPEELHTISYSTRDEFDHVSKNFGQATRGVSKQSSLKEAPDSCILSVIISINTLLSVLCIMLNTFIAPYYWKSFTTKIVHMVYFCTNIADIFAGIGVATQVVVLVLVLTEKVTGFCAYVSIMSYVISGVAIRFGVFLNVCLGTLRSINISRPFYQIGHKYVIISMFVYLSYWAGLVSHDCYYITEYLDFEENTVYIIKSLILKPLVGFSISSIVFNGTESHIENIVAFQFLPFMLPAMLFVMFLCIQIYHLILVKVNRNGHHGGHRPALTIFILTCIFVLCTSMSAVIWFRVYWDVLFQRGEIERLSWDQHFLIYVSSSTCNLLSSTLMPLTLIIRSTDLKRYVKHKINCRRLGGGKFSAFRTSLTVWSRSVAKRHHLSSAEQDPSATSTRAV